MRIAIIAEGYFPELSGVTTSLHQRLRWLSRWGHDVRLYVPDYSPLASLYPDYLGYRGIVMSGVVVVPFPSRPYYMDYTRDGQIFSFGKVAADIRAFQPDLIHVECPERLFMGFWTRPGVALARRLKVPTTALYHTNYLGYIIDYKDQIAWLRLPGVETGLRRLMAWVYNGYTLTMAGSSMAQEGLRAMGISRTRMVPFAGVDTERFHPDAGKGGYPSLDGRVRLLYVGRWTPDKQLDVLLEAFERVSQWTTTCGFVFIGGGPEEARIKAWAARHPEALVLGRIPHEQLPPYYSSADLFVTASTKENYPLTVREAMACGLPVIGPANGNLGDIFQHGQTGWRAQADDPEALAAAIETLVVDGEQRRRLSQNAVQMAQQRTWEVGARAMVEIWAGLCKERVFS